MQAYNLKVQEAATGVRLASGGSLGTQGAGDAINAELEKLRAEVLSLKEQLAALNGNKVGNDDKAAIANNKNIKDLQQEAKELKEEVVAKTGNPPPPAPPGGGKAPPPPLLQLQKPLIQMLIK